MSTYTISKGIHRRRDTDTDAETIRFSVGTDDKAKVFEVRIPRKIFDMLTDQQVTDYIEWCCRWHKRRFTDKDVTSPVVNSTLNARANSFVGNEITI